MAQFDVSETISSVKSDIIIALTGEDYEDQFEALARLIRSIASIERRLYDIDTLEAEKEQYKRWWHEERNKKPEG